MLTVGSLFSGIGGFDLGLERAGMRVIWQSEIDPYASAVLRKHWPDVPNHGDVRSISAGSVERVDVLCGGFPCQDISNAGKRAGIDGERSGLWSEFARIIGEIGPWIVIVENVSVLLNRGIERILADLAALGYDAEWHCIPASAVGAPHQRDRIWIVAYASGERLQGFGAGRDAGASHVRQSWRSPAGAPRETPLLANALRRELAQCGQAGRVRRQESISRDPDWQMSSEPFIRRGDDGFPGRVDRIRCLGNAIVPQIAEIIGRAIVNIEQCEETYDGDRCVLRHGHPLPHECDPPRWKLRNHADASLSQPFSSIATDATTETR